MRTSALRTHHTAPSMVSDGDRITAFLLGLGCVIAGLILAYAAMETAGWVPHVVSRPGAFYGTAQAWGLAVFAATFVACGLGLILDWD
jgi:hypothetical protein